MAKQVIKSPFVNHYGRLEMENIDGEWFLVMGDCMGPDYFGPLTQEQYDAFNVLIEAELAGDLTVRRRFNG